MTGPPLSCGEALRLLDEGLDRPLAPGEESALARHLEACAACRAEAAAVEAVHAALADEDAPAPLPDFTDRVVASLDRAPGVAADRVPALPPATRLLRGAIAVLGTAAVALLAVVVLPPEAAASPIAALVPPVPDLALPVLPGSLAAVVEGASATLPPWAAAAGALLAAAGAAAQVIALRARGGEGRR